MPALPSFSIPRRSFVKAFLLATASSRLGGLDWLGRFTLNVLADDVEIPDGTLVLSLKDFPPLQRDNGSVYIAAPGLPDIIVTRLRPKKFHAVTSVCTHQGCIVDVYDRDADALVCPCHHSHFAPDGTVLSGPAPKPLLSYKTHFDGIDCLTIDLVKVSFPISGAVVPLQGRPGERLRVTFASEAGFNYEIRHKISIADAEWENVMFSTVSDGPADQTLIMGTDEPISLFIDAAAASGFYLVVRWKLLGG